MAPMPGNRKETETRDGSRGLWRGTPSPAGGAEGKGRTTKARQRLFGRLPRRWPSRHSPHLSAGR
eukprot:scaffold648315_cov42-Prasinocladus_malaysianus.AAC.1